MFIGRINELEILEEAHSSDKSELVVIYGRRRIGKSSLVNVFLENKINFLIFEAIEGESTKGQIKHFTELLRKQVDDFILENVTFQDWSKFFYYLTEKVINKKTKTKKVIFFDELQWMAAGRARLISLLKFFWDSHWKNNDVMLILCGSIASFMINKVLKSKALYGRTTIEMHLKGFEIREANKFFKKKRGKEECLKYMMIFGCVPKYLEQLNLNLSFPQNINKLCFSATGIMFQEINRIFYNQFKEARTYRTIAELLKDGNYSFNEIAAKLNMASGGGLKLYLENLEAAEMVRSIIPLGKGINTKAKKYTLSDEFLIFYFKYMDKNRAVIEQNVSSKLFELLTKDSFEPWLGFAFEKFCLKHSRFIAGLMGFQDEVLLASPYFEKNDKCFQIDLIYKRADNIFVICEIKHQNKEVTTEIIPEMERKCNLFKVPRGYAIEKALISLYGPDSSLKKSQYFHHSVTLDDMLGDIEPG